MQVNVITDRRQEFNGESFYLCDKYYQHNGKRLHRAVWIYHNGEIPKGYHVHHKDGNRANNQIENLELLSGHDHMSLHMNTEEKKQWNREHADKIRHLTKEWHKSEEGRKWHSEHAKQGWEGKEPITYICTWCGKEFQTRHHYGANGNRFCCNNHRAYFNMRKRKTNASA